MTAGTEPVRWWILDRAIVPVTEPAPPADDPIWEARYTADCERGKRTTRNLDDMPEIAGAVAAMRTSAVLWGVSLGYPVTDDPTLHGGGLHVMEPGAELAVHLDYDRHPHLPDKRRALNLIAFLNAEWDASWGGALVLCDPFGAVVRRFPPVPGRLVAFEVGDLSYHGVERITGPAERVTAAVNFLSPAGVVNTRRRALFLPRRDSV